MNNRYLVWIKEGWAFFAITGIIVLTIIYFSHFEHSEKAYKCFSLIAQLFGGVFILYSINDNIKILQNKTIFFIVRTWLKSFPYFNQSRIVELKGVASVSFVGSAIATGTNHFNTLDEKVEYLLNEIKNIQKNLDQNVTKLNERITLETEKITEVIKQKNEKIELITINMEKILGSLNIPIFGVMLMIYATILGAIPDLFK
ncbi:MAG: hypothetical protein Q7T77_10460 [Sulfuricurvum sp.]|nr:hypothetical protein [Sulfuricurvum sp.]